MLTMHLGRVANSSPRSHRLVDDRNRLFSHKKLYHKSVAEEAIGAQTSDVRQAQVVATW